MLVTKLEFDPKRGYGFGVKTHYNDKHLGIDLVSKKTPLEFPVDLFKCTYKNGPQGGLTVYGEDKLGYMHRFMHNTEFKVNTPTIKAGTSFAISGNTGNLSTVDHVHWDIRKPNTPLADLAFENFIDPNIYMKEILPKLLPMSLPDWFKDNGTQKYCEDTKLIMDWSDPFRLVPQYVLGEYLRKANQIPTVKVYMNYNRFTITESELKAYRLAVRDVTRFFLPFINLEFQPLKKTNLDIDKQGKGATVEKGVNIYILKDLDSVMGESLNGFAIKTSRTILVDRDRLTCEDEKDRGMINGFAATIAHELCHVFGHYFAESDRTHYYDYEMTLSNYLPMIYWTRLNTDDKIKFNFA